MYIPGIQEAPSPDPTNRGLILFREVNEQNWTPEASAFFRSKTAEKLDKTAGNRARKVLMFQGSKIGRSLRGKVFTFVFNIHKE